LSSFDSGLAAFFFATSPEDFFSRNRNNLRAPAYERTDVRFNKAYVQRKFKTNG